MKGAKTNDRRGWVILATDTGVGKTFVGTHLARLLTQAGRVVRVRKPVESGCEEVSTGRGVTRLAADAEQLRLAAGDHESPQTVCPLRFLAALAPPEAAHREGRSLSFTRDLLPTLDVGHSAQEDIWLIEGAGGIYSPLADDALNVELARATGLPVILVAEDRLGTLSTTLSAVEALERLGVHIDAVVLNRHFPPADDAPDNLAALQQWIPRVAPGFSGRLLVIDRASADTRLGRLLPR
ncbi:MAG: dethiobiotin synthase [Guyparkeria sp.]|uniref:dethiobiotin synthase n=1 Tax=Guyparkeria sp. TaxID=2035736 RepID=UPI00397CA9E8